MSDFTLLTLNQCFVNYGRVEKDEVLDILKKRGTKAAITDFSILLGGEISKNYHIDSDNSLEGRTGYYWTKSNNGYDCTWTINGSGSGYWFSVANRNGGARPVLKFSSITLIPTNKKNGKKAKDEIIEVEYGYYPQKAVSKDMQLKLEQEFKSEKLLKTGRGFTTDSKKHDDYNEKFEPKRHEEYQYNEKRYVRIEANSCFDGEEFQLSNGERYRNGEMVWVEVLPVKWLVDKKAKIMLTEKIIFAGIQFNHTKDYQTENFDKTDIKMFMDEYLSKELEESRKSINLENVETKKSRLEKLNPDKTEISKRTKMTDTEIIHNWIESGESVLLRGPSGIGKTERIKSLYPDLIYLKLTNNMFPEKVVGSTNLQTGESIPPDFAKIAIMEGATEEEKKLIEENIQNIYKIADTIYERSKESEKKVVIMLDELLNVRQEV